MKVFINENELGAEESLAFVACRCNGLVILRLNATELYIEENDA